MPTETVGEALTRRGQSPIDDLAHDEDLERTAVTRGIQRLIEAGRVHVVPDPETGAALYALRGRRRPRPVGPDRPTGG